MGYGMPFSGQKSRESRGRSILMRQFLVDEIPRRKMEEIEVYLKEKAVSSGMEDILLVGNPGWAAFADPRGT